MRLPHLRQRVHARLGRHHVLPIPRSTFPFLAFSPITMTGLIITIFLHTVNAGCRPDHQEPATAGAAVRGSLLPLLLVRVVFIFRRLFRKRWVFLSLIVVIFSSSSSFRFICIVYYFDMRPTGADRGSLVRKRRERVPFPLAPDRPSQVGDLFSPRRPLLLLLLLFSSQRT